MNLLRVTFAPIGLTRPLQVLMFFEPKLQLVDFCIRNWNFTFCEMSLLIFIDYCLYCLGYFFSQISKPVTAHQQDDSYERPRGYDRIANLRSKLGHLDLQVRKIQSKGLILRPLFSQNLFWSRLQDVSEQTVSLGRCGNASLVGFNSGQFHSLWRQNHRPQITRMLP